MGQTPSALNSSPPNASMDGDDDTCNVGCLPIFLPFLLQSDGHQKGALIELAGEENNGDGSPPSPEEELVLTDVEDNDNNDEERHKTLCQEICSGTKSNNVVAWKEVLELSLERNNDNNNAREGGNSDVGKDV